MNESLPLLTVSVSSVSSGTQSLTAKLASFFEAHEGEWIDGMRLAGIAGSYAWRSRCSDLRTKFGMRIENRQRRVNGYVQSEYRFVREDN